MAIKKSKVLDSGVTGDYWKIVQVILDAQSKICFWKLELFLSESRKDGVGLGVFKGIEKNSLTKAQMNGDLRALGYLEFKKDSDFVGSVDV